MIVITGATGHTGKPAAEALLAGGTSVRVVSRDAKKLDQFVARGAEAFVGSAEDRDAMAKAFEGADAVYLVVPEDSSQPDLRAHQERISDSYAAAVAHARVPYVVALSSIGAQHAEGTGPIVGLHNMEQKLNRIPGLNVLFLRPGYFMENLLMTISAIRSMGILPGGMKSDIALPWIATRDIGTYAASRLAARDFSGSSVQELHGQRDLLMKDAASIVGSAIGNPHLGYMQAPFLMLESALVNMGLSKSSAALVIEMWKGANAGLIVPQQPRTAQNTTSTTIEWFAQEVFAPAYKAKTTAA